MADDGAGGVDFQPGLVVRAILEETRNAVTLHPPVIERTLVYIMEFAEGEDADEVKECLPSDTPGWITAFTEAWEGAAEKAMPAFMRARAGVWAGEAPAAVASPGAPWAFLGVAWAPLGGPSASVGQPGAGNSRIPTRPLKPKLV